MSGTRHTFARAVGAVAVVTVVGAASFAVTRSIGSARDAGTEPAPTGSGPVPADVAEIETAPVPVLSPVPTSGGAEDPALVGLEGTGPDDAVAAPEAAALSRSLGRVFVPVEGTAAAEPGGLPVLAQLTGGPIGADASLFTNVGDAALPSGPTGDPDVVSTPPAPPRVTEQPDSLLGDPGDALGEAGFIDPCAGESPGTGREDSSCPDGSEGATVLGTFALESPPPLWVVGYPWPPDEDPDTTFVAQCPATEPREGVVPFGITASNPSTFTLTWWTDRDPTVHRQELATDDADRAAWTAWVEAGASDRRRPFDLPRTCTELVGLHVGETVYWDLVAVDDALQVASAADTMVQTHFSVRAPSTPEGARVRPPTRVLAPRANEVAIVAPVRPGQDVQVFVYPRNATAGGDPCTSLSLTDHPGFDDPTYTWLGNVSEIASEARFATAYPWDRDYDRNQWGALRVPAGRDLRLCVVRHRSDGPTYTWGPEDVEAIEISTPDLRSFEVHLTDVSSREDLAPGALTISTRPANRPLLTGGGCWGRYVSGGLSAGDNPVDEVVCIPGTNTLDLFTRGVVVDIGFREPGGEPVEQSVVLPVRVDCAGPCAPIADETYRIELPTVSRPAGLCGESIFGSCEPPRVDQVLGTATLEVHYGEGGGNGATRWWVGPTEPLGDARPEAVGPQLDLASPGSPVGAVEAPGWRQQLGVDRPVTVEASLTSSSPDDELCTTSDAAVLTATVTEPSATPNVEFSGLCPGTTYLMVVHLTDADGVTTSYGYPRTPGLNPWIGAAFTTRSIELGVTATIEIGPLPGPGDGAFIHQADVAVNGTSLRWLNEVTGCRPDWRRINANPASTGAGTTVHLSVRVRASGARGSDGCVFARDDGTPTWDGATVVLAADLPWAEAVGAEEIVLSSGADDGFPVTVTFRLNRVR